VSCGDPSQLSALIEGLDWTRVREIDVRAAKDALACDRLTRRCEKILRIEPSAVH
jgi:hypothetical protein